MDGGTFPGSRLSRADVALDAVSGCELDTMEVVIHFEESRFDLSDENRRPRRVRPGL